ncbi:DUF3349 domain-containing protein [Mycobacterium simiae]|uniref:DUF3349 domain-containing protein n=1 Tax=Mycobacterium simiae TaxID=1784 RepID=UPI0009DB7B25
MTAAQLPLSGLVNTFDAVIRAGYPRGVPVADYLPLLALLRRRLPDNAVAAVAARVAAADGLDIDAAAIRAVHRRPRGPTAGRGRSGARAAPARGDHRIGPTVRVIRVSASRRWRQAPAARGRRGARAWLESVRAGCPTQ